MINTDIVKAGWFFGIVAVLLVTAITGFIFAAEEASSPQEAEFTYNSHGRRDPFVPLITEDGRIIVEKRKVESVEDLVLEGIMWDPKAESLCMINGEVLKAGDEISGFVLKEINPTAVVLSSGGEEHVLSIIE